MRPRRWPIVTTAILIAACAGPVGEPSSPPRASTGASATSSAAQSVEPTVSTDPGEGPIGGQIAYVGGLEDPQIFLLDLQTGGSRQLTHLRLEDAELTGEGPLRPALSCGFGPSFLTWSPDGSRLAFTYGSCDTVVFVVDLDGELRRIGDGRSPTWSPDGSRLLFAANVPYFPCGGPCADQPPPAPGAWDLQVVEVSGDEAPQPFTRDGSTSSAGGPSYSPDGSTVAFSAPSDGADAEVFSATYVIGADGSGARQVADGGYPTGWLPDGRLLLSREKDQSIHAVNIETGESEQIGAPQTTSVSPDGTRSLVWTSDPVSGASGLRLLTADGDVIGDTLGSFGAWSPDSGAFAVFGNDGGLHLVSRDGALLASYEIGPSGGPAAWRPGS